MYAAGLPRDAGAVLIAELDGPAWHCPRRSSACASCAPAPAARASRSRATTPSASASGARARARSARWAGSRPISTCRTRSCRARALPEVLAKVCEIGDRMACRSRTSSTPATATSIRTSRSIAAIPSELARVLRRGRGDPRAVRRGGRRDHRRARRRRREARVHLARVQRSRSRGDAAPARDVRSAARLQSRQDLPDDALLRRIESEGARLRPGAVARAAWATSKPSLRSSATRCASTSRSRSTACRSSATLGRATRTSSRPRCARSARRAARRSRAARAPSSASATRRGAPTASSTSTAFSGVDELDASEGVCHAGAATPLAELRARVRDAGWELPLDDAAAAARSAGARDGVVAPRALGFGRPRDIVLGCEGCSPTALATRCGGRVVKNVTGYDMAKLYTGSLGSIGVITAPGCGSRRGRRRSACSQGEQMATRKRVASA